MLSTKLGVNIEDPEEYWCPLSFSGKQAILCESNCAWYVGEEHVCGAMLTPYLLNFLMGVFLDPDGQESLRVNLNPDSQESLKVTLVSDPD